MVIPAKARKEARIDKGDVVSVQPEGDGRLVLVRLERPKLVPAKFRVRRGKAGHLVIRGVGRAVSREEVSRMLEQFPP